MAKISLCMIVKDEGKNIERCLRSAADTVDEIIVVDTGSQDTTCQIARKFGAQVFEFAWNGSFSDARNVSLAKATGDWILCLDADEELSEVFPGFLHTLTEDSQVEGYFVKILSYINNEGWIETCPDLVFRLFRNRPEYRFHGAIYEQIADVILQINPKANYKIAEGISIIHYGYLEQEIKAKNEQARNIQLIEQELALRPDNRLLRYHYGVELYRAERFAEAATELTKAANGIDPATIYLPKLLRYIVLAHQGAKQYTGALYAAELGLKFFPDYADLYYYTGLIHLELKHYASARSAFLRAVSMPEQPPRYASFDGTRGFRSYYHLGQIAEQFMDYEEALRYYIESLKDNPNFIYPLENIIKILNPRKNPDYTAEYVAKITEFSHPQTQQILGEIYFRAKAYGLALACFEKIAGSGSYPDDNASKQLSPEIRLWKAICLIQQRRHLEGLIILNDYTPDSPLFPLAKVNILLTYYLQGKDQKVRTVFKELQRIGLAEDTEKVLSLLLDTPVSEPEAEPLPEPASILLNHNQPISASSQGVKATTAPTYLPLSFQGGLSSQVTLLRKHDGSLYPAEQSQYASSLYHPSAANPHLTQSFSSTSVVSLPSSPKQLHNDTGSPRITLGPEGLALFLDILERLLALNEMELADTLLNKLDAKTFSGQELKLAKLLIDYGASKKAEKIIREYLQSSYKDETSSTSLLDQAEAHFLLAEILAQQSKYLAAEQHYRYAIELNSDEPRYYIRQIALYDQWRQEILAEALEKYPDMEIFRRLHLANAPVEEGGLVNE